jgi:hypothetical protein
MNDRIFIGKYPAGLVYSDRKRERAGDYAKLAFLPYSTLKLEVEKDCPTDLRAQIEQHAAQYKPGQVLQVSTAGQTVTLGLGDGKTQERR